MSIPKTFKKLSKIYLLPEPPSEVNTLYDFGSFRLNEGERQLVCNGRTVNLKTKDLDVLLVLLKSSSRLVTKTELLNEVWPDSYVSDANLSVHIGFLRKVLRAHSAGPSYIQTVYGCGYRFVGEVKVIDQTRSDQKVLSSESDEQRIPYSQTGPIKVPESVPVGTELNTAILSLAGGLRIEARKGPFGTEIFMMIPESRDANLPNSAEHVTPLKIERDGLRISSIRQDGMHCVKVAL